MTIWSPSLDDRAGPKYRAIAEVIADDIAAGRLQPGTRLPPQRDLAWTLGVTVGTVSRAYTEAEKLGLVRGEVGRGTYVLRPGLRDGFPLRDPYAADAIDLSLSFPAPGAEGQFIAGVLSAMAGDPNAADLLEYQQPAGVLRHRAAGAAWLATTGVEVAPEQLVITTGAQNGILVALAALTQPGDQILTEALTFPGVKPVAAMLGLRLEGVAIDAEGLIPEALEAACRGQPARVLYLVPTVHNPTAVVMPPARRAAIAEIARRHDLTVVEDDIAARCIAAPPPPIATLAPERTLYLTSLSKTVAPGLRIGYLAGPPGLLERNASVVRASAWMAVPLAAELAARWIEDGTAERILESRRTEAVARHRMTRETLASQEISGVPGSNHLWLTLPEPWRAGDFAAEAQRRGVIVSPAETFAAGRAPAPQAVRLCIGMPRRRASLATALGILAEVLGGPAPRDRPVV